MENIFIEQNIKDYESITLSINNRNIKNAYKLVRQINTNPGYIFILNSFDNKVYVGEIVKISNEQEPIKHRYKININFEDYYLYLVDGLEEYKINILEMICSRNQFKNYMETGNSLSKTYYNKRFKYSRPIILNYDFQLYKLEKYEFCEKILENKSLLNFNSNKKIYAKYLTEDGNPYFSLTTEKMISEDIKATDVVTENYRPYFYEFYIEDKSLIQVNGLEHGEIYEVKISSDFSRSNKGEFQEIRGTVFFSASPPYNFPLKLEITKRLNNYEKSSIVSAETWLRDVREKVNDGKYIEDKIMEYFPNNEEILFESTIYNIGQGNWSKISAYDFRGDYLDIVYDIGIGSSNNLSLTKLIAKQAASEIREKHIFILSHWDLDHIKGIIYLSSEQFETIWIVPELPTNLSFSAIRLALYLYNHKNIEVVFVSDELNNSVIFSNQYLSLGKGEGKGQGTLATRNNHSSEISYTQNNNIGLILCIKNSDEKILFTGDCEYIQLPEEFINERYYAIVMAHHGAKIKYKDLTQIGMLPASINESKAYVCVGKNHKYPNFEHVVAIKNLDFEVIETRSYTDINNQIKIKLPTLVCV